MTADDDAPEVTCEEFVEMVTEYLDGALPADVVATIDAHLEVCPGCVTVVEQWRAVVGLAGELREDDVDALPPQLRDDLMSSFRSALGS
jgi:anti-sigma factor RsiW